MLTNTPNLFFKKLFPPRCIILSRWNPLTVRKQVVSGFIWDAGWHQPKDEGYSGDVCWGKFLKVEDFAKTNGVWGF